MKTTVELPDELLREVKELAQQQGTSMRELMIEGLRAEIARRREPDSRVDVFFPVFAVEAGDRMLVAPEDAVALSYGDRA